MVDLKDSGERKIFEGGAMREIFEGKGRCDLLPLDVVADILNATEPKKRILELINDFLRTGDIVFIKEVILQFSDERRWDLITMFIELSIHYEDGARKYADNNWKKGLPVHSFIDSGVRHYLKWLRGDQDEPHDRAFIWNMVGVIWTMENKPELNDICGY